MATVVVTAFGIALIVSLTVTPVVTFAARRLSMWDEPNHRSSHVVPIPRGGGVAVAIGAVAGVAVGGELPDSVNGLVVGAVVLGLTGLIDDCFGLAARPRLVVQLAAALALALFVVERNGFTLVLVAVAVAFAITAYVNAFNFMDGINGIAGTQAAIAGLFLAAVADSTDATPLAIAALAMCGAAIGFIPFNAVHPWVFLGDVGSYFIGFWLAGLALLIVQSGASPIVAVAPFMLYLGDTSTVLIRRARRGERLADAHREHAYQQLVQLGLSHLTVTLLCAGVSAITAATMLLVVDSSTLIQTAAFAIALIPVTAYLLLPEFLRRRVSPEGR